MTMFALADESWITIAGMLISAITGWITLIVNGKVNRIETRGQQNVDRLENLGSLGREVMDEVKDTKLISANTLQASHDAKTKAAEAVVVAASAKNEVIESVKKIVEKGSGTKLDSTDSASI
jgi:hypothetical protein